MNGLNAASLSRAAIEIRRLSHLFQALPFLRTLPSEIIVVRFPEIRELVEQLCFAYIDQIPSVQRHEPGRNAKRNSGHKIGMSRGKIGRIRRVVHIWVGVNLEESAASASREVEVEVDPGTGCTSSSPQRMITVGYIRKLVVTEESLVARKSLKYSEGFVDSEFARRVAFGEIPERY